MDTSFAAKSCFGGSKRKITPFSTSILRPNSLNYTDKKSNNKGLKRAASLPLPLRNDENLRNKEQEATATPEKRLSKLYRFISNDKMRTTTRGILKKSTPNATHSMRENINNQHPSNGITTDHDPTYGFASRYSDSKSYFRTQNVDNTIPRVVQREDLLQVYPTAESSANFRDVLFPLRASNGSNKSNNSIKAADTVDTTTANWCLPTALKEDFADFNISTPPQKKRVKFDESLDNLKEQQPPPSFEFQHGQVTHAGSRHSLRERIYDFFANLF